MKNLHEIPSRNLDNDGGIETAWVEKRLKYFGGLETPGVANVGSEFQITYIPKDESETKIVSGLVVESSQARTIIQDRESGELIVVNTNDDEVKNVKSRLITKESPRFKECNFKYVMNELKQGQSVFGVCLFFKDSKRILLSGSFTIEEISNDYKVLKIVDSNQVEHFLDPDIIDCSFSISQHQDDITPFKSSSEAISLIDNERNERIQLAEELVNGADILGDKKYYDYFQKDIERTKKILMRWYGHRIPGGLFEKIEEELGPEYIAYLADPGIMQNINDFISFARNVDDFPSPEILRKEFSEYLGEETVFRGMMLTDADVASIKEHGILSSGLLDNKRAVQILQETLAVERRQNPKNHATNFFEEIMGRLTDFVDPENYTSISVSTHESIARSVGYHSSGQSDNNTKKMYLFECRVPKISLIKSQGIFAVAYRSNSILTIDGVGFDESKDLGVEMFVPYVIPPEEIKRITLINETPPKWTRS